MNTTVRNPLHRRLAAAGGVVVAIAVIAALLLIGPAPARASSPGAVSKELITPAALSPLQLLTQTPEPGVSVTVQSGGGSTSLKAVPFRPKIQITRGQPVVAPQGANKPAKSYNKSAGDVLSLQAAPNPPNYSNLISAQGWVPLLQEDFNSFSPTGFGVPFSPASGTSNWTVYDYSPTPYYRSWGKVDYTDGGGYWAGWPAAFGPDSVDWHGGYTNTLDSWLDYGPLNLSAMSDFYVSFQLWYDTEPQWDWVYFCVSTNGSNYDCDYWSGYSGGWMDQAYWLTSYAGYSTVYVAWEFVSDSSISGDYGYLGPFIDNIYVWGDNTPPATPPPLPTAGQLIQNGSFENNPGLQYWNTIQSSNLGTAGEQGSARPEVSAPSGSDGNVDAASVVVTTTYSFTGTHSAALLNNSGTGNDFLYQAINVPAGVNGVVIDYWFKLLTSEATSGRDHFCASLRPLDLSSIKVDLGCMDAVGESGDWQESIFTLTSSDIAQIAGSSVALDFEMYNTGGAGTGTTLWVDYVRLYATGTGAGAAIDPHEPNNDLASATTGLACGGTITGTVGDALGGYDIDWFKLNITQTVSLQLDIDARTKVQDPRSTLDSVLRLYNAGGTQIDVNDDDGVTYDSFISRTVSAGTYYASVESYTGAGGPYAYYDLAERCNSAEAAPVGGNVQAPPADTWTVMLYLNGEDPSFAPILTQYRHDIEAFIANKPFLKVVILYDGPNIGDTVRYWVQPNGNYQLGVNMWTTPNEVNMGDPDTLANFVSGVMTTYQFQAENYYLAIDDHGNGASGTSWDTNPTPNNQPQLTPPEVYSALKDATQNGDRKISIVDFESCLMGLAENAYDMRQWADYVVFSEQISWGINTYPVYFSDLAAADTPLTVGQRIVDRYSAGAIAAHEPHTISLVDTSQMPAVRTAVTAFANALVASNDQTHINQARTASQAFAASNDATNPYFADYIDLYDFAAQASSRGLAVSQAAAVQAAVQAAVVAERHISGGVVIGPTTYNWNHSRAHGLSIYFPTDRTASSFDAYIAQTLYQMTQVDATAVDGTWDEFLDWVYPVSTGVGGHNGRGMSSSRTELRLIGGTTFISVPIYLPLVKK